MPASKNERTNAPNEKALDIGARAAIARINEFEDHARRIPPATRTAQVSRAKIGKPRCAESIGPACVSAVIGLLAARVWGGSTALGRQAQGLTCSTS